MAMLMRQELPERELNDISRRLEPVASGLKDARILLTGGTGFVGSWLAESFLNLERRCRLNADLVILTRDIEGYLDRRPHMRARPRLHLHQGDLRRAESLPGIEGITHVIHAGSDVNRRMSPSDALRMLDTLDLGTEHLLHASRAWPLRRCLYISSAAVYGPDSGGGEWTEHSPGCPSALDATSAYGMGKRIAELRVALHGACNGFSSIIARLGALIGPLLPLDGGFAAGNFLSNALCGEKILVKGDGTAIRSYQYAGDLAVWLWTLLLCGKPGEAYNVGGDAPLSLADLARMIDRLRGTIGVDIQGETDPRRPVDRYCPSVRKAVEELGLANRTSLEEAILKTLDWLRGPTASPEGMS